MKKLLPKIILVCLGLVVLLCGFVYVYYQAAVNRKNYDGKGEAEFVITSGQRVYEIADNLKKARLINSATAFKLYVRLNNLGSKLQAGYYRIPRDLSLKDLVYILQHGKFDLKLTFPEGWRIEEMAFYAANQLGGGETFYREFLKEASGLEGFLFPETYIVPREITAKELVTVMNETFEKKYRIIANASGPVDALTKSQIITVASMLEREARRDEDRPIIAGILLKRLRSGWPLEVDATVQYAMASRQLPSSSFSKLETFDFWPREITLDALKADSPYNTRKRLGLPPTPICDPGLLSIEAIFKSVETPYWFYLTGTDGTMRYAATITEHNRNIDQYLRP
jgi:UPF0755 protein